MSSPLAQQEVFTPPPARRLIVAPGFESHWGVDVSVSRVSIAFVASEGRRGARTASFAKLDGGARLAHIWWETGSFVRECLGYGFPLPGLVVVEHPFGKTPNPPLLYAVGVVQASIFDALKREYGREVAVETCASAWWKKAATGYGRHDKPTKEKLGRTPEFLDYGVARWAVANGYQGSSWDEADALGIAEAARRTVALEPR